MTTINQIRESLKQFAEAHYQINGFHWGELSEAYAKDRVLHPLMNCTMVSSRMRKQTTEYTIQISISDLVKMNLINRDDVESDTHVILKDVDTFFRSKKYRSIYFINDITSPTQFRTKLATDFVYGWMFQAVFRVVDMKVGCDVPLDGLDITDGTYTALCKPARLFNSDGTFDRLIASGDSYTLPSSGLVNILNSDGSFDVTKTSADSPYTLPDIQFTDSDGTTSIVPSVKDIVAAPCVLPSKIAYKRPLFTGQETEYRTGDAGYRFQNGIDDYTPPAYPLNYARLDLSSVTPYLTLVDNNAFGNKNRFTDSLGTQLYADSYVIDHLSGKGLYFRLGFVGNWNNCIDQAFNSVQNGFNDWYCLDVNDFNSIANLELDRYLGLIPTYNPDPSVWLSNTRSGSTTNKYRYVRNAGEIQVTGSNSNSYMYMTRNHYT